MKKEENKYFYLVKNVGVLIVGSFGSKFLSFFLLPLYTNVLTTEEYGVADFINTTVGLLIPIFTLNIYDAVFRIAMEKKRDKEDVLRTGCWVFGLGYIVVALLLLLNNFFNVIPILNTYVVWCLVLYCFQALNSILLQYARAVEHVKDVAISGVISTFTICGTNIICLLLFPMGLKGYLLAMVLGQVVADIYLIFRLKIVRAIRRFVGVRISKDLRKDMLSYSMPLIITNVSWWIINASDRYMVTGICGVGENGIYSIAYRIPGILAILQNLFAQAWQISAVYEKENSVGKTFYKNVYTQYNIFNAFVCAGLIAINRPLASLLFANDFYVAWQYVPWLLFATVFSALSGYMGGILAASKDTKGLSLSCAWGAVVNVVLNIIFLNVFGTIGAAYATLISYMVTFVYRLVAVKRQADVFLLARKDIIVYTLIGAECCIATIDMPYFRYGMTAMVLLIMVCVTWSEIRKILYVAMGFLKQKKERK